MISYLFKHSWRNSPCSLCFKGSSSNKWILWFNVFLKSISVSPFENISWYASSRICISFICLDVMLSLEMLISYKWETMSCCSCCDWCIIDTGCSSQTTALGFTVTVLFVKLLKVIGMISFSLKSNLITDGSMSESMGFQEYPGYWSKAHVVWYGIFLSA